MRLTDTAPEAERVLVQVYRRMSPGQKWLRLGETYRTARTLHAAGVRFRNPEATNQQIHEEWLRMQLGCALPEVIREAAVDVQSLREVRAVLAVLSRLDIRYALGGSMASSVHGIGRFTRDADVTVEPFFGKEEKLAASFGPDYYVSLPAIQDAVRTRSSFNIINTSTGFKVDIFVRADNPFEQSALARRIPLSLPDAPDEPVFVHSPEDTILFKLRWYRLGSGISDQQWNDIRGVLQVQAGKLDDAYLDRWAAELQVSDLLARAREESRI
jgi:hypothetical protein